MSGPAGATGTLADVVEQGPDLRGVRPAGPDSFAPAPEFGELFHAYRAQGRAYRTDFDEIMLRDGYAPIVDALGLGASQNPAAFYDNKEAHEPILNRSDILARRGGGLLSSMADRRTQEGLIVEELRARRAKDPNFLAGVPDTVDGLHQYFLEAEAKKRQAATSTIARGSGGLSQALTGLAGGGFEAFHDPLNIVTLPIGGGGKTLIQTAGREALVNGLVEALSLPSAAHNLDELGEKLTAGEAVQDVVTAGAFAGLIGGTIHLAGAHLPPALFAAMPESVQRRWADRMKVGAGKDAPRLVDVLGDMDNRELAGFARSTIGDKMTPDERAAADVLEREQELGAASPFMPGPAGDGAHQANLAASLKAIIDGADHEAPSRAGFLASSSLTPAPAIAARPVSIGAASVPHDIVDFFRAKGLEEGQAYGIAAGISAEARGDHRAYNPASGAIGLGQWLGSRKAELIRRYGPNPSRQEQLEFLWHELTGGDAGGKHVLAEKDPARVLDAYVRKFMRPAAGAETAGDLERGMAALGRGGELPERSAAGDLGDDPELAALRREADQAEQEATALAEGERGGDVELGARSSELSADDLPILKRELFASDQDWFEAQVAFHQEIQGEIAPQEPGNGPPAREAAGGPAEVARALGAASTPEQALDRLLEEHPDLAPNIENYRDRRAELVANAGRIADLPDRVLDRLVDVTGRSSGKGQGHLVMHFADNFGSTIEWDPAGRDVTHSPAKKMTLRQLEDRLEIEQFDMAAKVDRAQAFRAEGLSREQVLARLAEKVAEERASLAAELGRPGSSDVMVGVKLRRLSEEAAYREAIDLAFVRIDDPELKVFDDGGSGREQQIESLEHDLRAEASAEVSFVVGPARYSKDNVLVQVRNERGYKSRATRLIENLGGRWTGREHGYVMSSAAVAKLEKLHAAGFDADIRYFADSPISFYHRERELKDLTAAQALKAADAPATAKSDQAPNAVPAQQERRYQLADDREPQTLAEILAELDADRAAVDALRACTVPAKAAA